MAVIMLKMMVFTMLPFVFDYFVNKNLMFHVVSPKRNFFIFLFFIFYFFADMPNISKEMLYTCNSTIIHYNACFDSLVSYFRILNRCF